MTNKKCVKFKFENGDKVWVMSNRTNTVKCGECGNRTKGVIDWFIYGKRKITCISYMVHERFKDEATTTYHFQDNDMDCRAVCEEECFKYKKDAQKECDRRNSE